MISELLRTWAPYILFADAVALAVGAFWISAKIRRLERRNAERVEKAVTGRMLAAELELQAPFAQRVLQPMMRSLLRRLGALSPQGNLEKLRRQLLIAGSPMRLSGLDFMGLRVLAAALGLVGGTLALMPVTHSFIRALLAGLAGAAIFSELPNMWLRSKMGARRKEIMLALADAMDILTVCVDAGLGLESAFMRIGQNWSHALAQEFKRAVMEMGVGISWRESMRNLVYRTDVAELSALVAVLLQADQLGFSISDTLHSQADQLRMRRRQRAQEMARSAPFKMLFPMVLFIMPALFAVIIGPAVPVLMESFKGM